MLFDPLGSLVHTTTPPAWKDPPQVARNMAQLFHQTPDNARQVKVTLVL
jgi:hypothetical protein